MGDIQSEIGSLLAETSPPEASDETEGTQELAASTESGESGGETQEAGSEEETSEAGQEGEQSESEDSEEVSSESKSEEESEEDPRDAQIRELQAEVNRLSKQEVDKNEETDGESETTETETSSDFDPFMGQEFDSIIEDKESFQKWAEGFYKQAKKDAHEEVLRKLPDTVSSYVQHQVSIQKAVDDFYSTHDDLADYKDYVSRIANEVQAENSDWTFNQVLEETAKRARQKLGLKERAQSSGKENSSQKKPPLAKGNKSGSSKARSGGSSGDELSNVEKEIQDILGE